MENVTDEYLEDVKKDSKTVRWGVFIPMFLLISSAVVLGIFQSEALITLTKDFFNWSLQNFGWLYQWVSMIALILAGILLTSRYGHIRIGGKEAKAGTSFGRWFAMALSSGVATGLITYGVNEPIIYFGSVYGELSQVGVQPLSSHAEMWALGRVFYNWGFIPYSMYTLSGLIAAYMYYNKKKGLSVAATLEPLLGKYARNKAIADLIDVLATMAIVLSLASGLGTGLTVVVTGLKVVYGYHATTVLWVSLGALTTFLFTFSSYLGLDKGFKILASIKSKVLYFLLILLFVTGPTFYILRSSTAGMAVWLDNFFLWGLDPIDIGGPALTQWWTLFDWAVWIAYAPLMGMFLALISYGRTIKEFIIVNWILPSCFALLWFAVWGGTSIYLQKTGVLDLVQIIKDNGAVSGLWAFLQHLPFHLGFVIVPLILVLTLFSSAVAANSITTTIAGMCSKNVPIGEEAPAFQRIIWGVLIGSIAIIVSAFGGGGQGIDGIKYLAVCGGFCVLFIFMLQLMSIIKTFFYDKPIE